MKKGSGRLLRTLTAALFLLLTAIGLLFHTGWGTLSSFGVKSIAQICPLGSLEVLFAEKTFIPRVIVPLLVFFAAAAVFGRIFCGWICPATLLNRLFGAGKTKPKPARDPFPVSNEKTAPALKDERSARCGGASSCAACASCSGTGASGSSEPAASSGAKKTNYSGPLCVLAGTLASSAVFGFPVFCLVCPVGLTFALVIALWRLFEFNEATWSIVYFAGFLILELAVLRHWCHRFCPLGALISLMSRANRFFRPTVNPEACLEKSKGIACRVCREACPEGIDLTGSPTAADWSRCTKCRTCADSCPRGAISFPPAAKFLKSSKRTAEIPPVRPAVAPPAERLAGFGESEKPLSLGDAVKESSRCLRCGKCSEACPQGTPIPGVMTLLSEGKAGGAGRLLLGAGFLPEFCSRVCPHERLCENACSLSGSNGHLSVGALERFAAESALSRGWRPVRKRARAQKKVAVVGAGPAGLACADVLARFGAAVTIFDQQSEPGGMLMHGIPGFKLDKKLVVRRIEILKKLQVDLRCGTKVGRDAALRLLAADFDAVFLGTGAWRSVAAAFDGSEGTVVNAIDFLSRYGSAPSEALRGRKVLVLGGGDTAVDCARTALRQGAEGAAVLCRRPLSEIRAAAPEKALAEEEGVRFIGEAAAVRAEKNAEGALAGLVVCRAGAEETVPGDVVVAAFGFRADPPEDLGSVGVEADDEGRIRTDADGRTSNAKIWAGGDAVRGPDLVVRAAADGRRAGLSIAKTLGIAS